MHTFSDLFGRSSEVSARAPGRVNLLGEHTDYNEGFVLPTIIPQETRVEIAHSRDDLFRFYSANLKQLAQVAEQGPPPHGFAQYIYGCIDVVRKRGDKVPAVSIFVESSVPVGSGLSSSAALEVSVLRGLRKLLGLSLNDVELALLAQQAEIQYAGVQCGILDQMACSLGQANHALQLDTRTLESHLLPLPENATLVILDSGVPRSLANTAYNKRRGECQTVAQMLGVRALRDITDLDRLAGVPDPLKRRARHVITENARVLEASKGVSAEVFGRLMNQSHASLRDDYEVSIPPLDLLVDLLQNHAGVYGARLTGAGFGGACVALVRPDVVSQVKQRVLAEYSKAGFHGSALV